jgi:hypothetical protein
VADCGSTLRRGYRAANEEVPVSQQDYVGRSRIFQADGADAGDVSYSITLEGNRLVSGRVSSGALVAGAPAVPETLVDAEQDRPLYLQLEDGRWVALRIVNAAGELDRSGGVVRPPRWADTAK